MLLNMMLSNYTKVRKKPWNFVKTNFQKVDFQQVSKLESMVPFHVGHLALGEIADVSYFEDTLSGVSEQNILK